MAHVGKAYDVIIAGAGPVGLFLACELALARVSVLILEKDSDSRSPWKTPHLGGRGLDTVAMEALHRRGLLKAISNPAETPQLATNPGAPPFGGHFAGMPLSTKHLDLGRSRWRLPGPALFPARTHMQRIEDVLAERASSSGVAIRRGEGIGRIEKETSHDIEMTTSEGERLRSRWLVGCDGGRSTVRREAGIAFRGTDARTTGYMMKCTVDHPERLEPEFHCADNGLWISARGSIIGMTEPDGAAFDRSQEPSRQHLQGVFERVSGVKDVKITQVDYVGTYTDACRQAELYRKGRVLLAGDSAHIHSPMGAQGLTTGIGDAVNLGWKLAAVIRREKSEASAGESSGSSMQNALLDTYEEERRPEGAWALEWTRAQVLALEPGLFGRAMRNLLRDLLATKEGTNTMLDKLWGLDQRYEWQGHGMGHPLIGRSVPDFELPDGARLGDHMHHGKGMLVALRGSVDAAWLRGGYEDRLESLGITPTETLGIDALLVRPDGVVAWVAEEGVEPNLGALQEALEMWFAF